MRWILLSASLLLVLGCATAKPPAYEPPDTKPSLPGTSEMCEQLTRPDDRGPYAAVYRCRMEGQVCLVMQFASPFGGGAMDCEDEED